MTPFDPVALLVMLQAFYPIPTVINLQRARRERPEYFAAGTLFGSSGEKLLLPDGRAFDLIFDAGGPRAHWQVIPAGGTDGGNDDLFPLEPGPLAPLDPGFFPAPIPDSEFEGLMAGALGELQHEPAALAAAAQTIVGGVAGTVAAAEAGAELAEAEGAIGEIHRSRYAEDLADVIGQTNGIDGAIASVESEYDDPPPDVELPREPDTPEWPTDGGVQPLPPQPGPQPYDP